MTTIFDQCMFPRNGANSEGGTDTGKAVTLLRAVSIRQGRGTEGHDTLGHIMPEQTFSEEEPRRNAELTAQPWKSGSRPYFSDPTPQSARP